MSNEQKTQQHTPGPWKVYFDDVYKEGEPVIEGVSVVGVPDKDGDETEQIAYIINDSVDDARLIAAAPDLLAALKNLRDWIEEQKIMELVGFDDEQGLDDVMTFTRIALEKAEA
jgi:hypothetical protein